MSGPRTLKVGLVDLTCGDDVTIIEPSNLYGCTLGDRVFVGPFVEIQKGVTIGARTRIQSHAFICEMVEIGSDCFVSHGVMFVNDLFSAGGPAGGRREMWKPTRIGNNVSIGSNATILPISICDHVVIGAGAVVTRDIVECGYYAGVPAKKIRSI